jgi:hypothetical protein
VVCIDLSHTLLYGFEGKSKLEAMVEIVALLYLLAGETHDVVRVNIWAHKTINLPPKKGQEGLTIFIAMMEKLGLLDENGQVILKQPANMNALNETEKIAQLKAFLARRKEVIYLGDLSLMKDKELWGKILDKKNMHCFRIYSPVDKNTGMPFLFKAKNPINGKGMVTDIKGQDEQPLFTKERFKEIGVHERYLERFVRELV